jgi:hypothetical protein
MSRFSRRPVLALLGLIVIVLAELYGIAMWSEAPPPDFSLLSCAACHD